MMSAPRPYHEWTEEVGDVLWWLWPIVDAPYCGTPMDLGYTVEIDLGIASSQRTFEPVETKRSIQIGGWPFDERDDNEGYHRLFWTELPNFDALDVAIRDCIRGEPDEPQPRSRRSMNMDKDGPETMREAVARAMVEPLGYPNTLDWERVYIGDITEDGSLADLCRDLADAAIRTVLERLREVTPAMEAAGDALQPRYPFSTEIKESADCDVIWQAMLDAAAREVGCGN